MTSIIDTSRLSQLLLKHQTPFYIYNKNILYDTIEEIQGSFAVDNFQLLFATMANDNPEFLKAIHSRNVGACINSIRHLELVLNAGFSPGVIQYTSTGIRKEDIKVLYEKKITVNFDSLLQLKYWYQLQPGLKAGLRINTASLSDTNQFVDRLGVEKECLEEALQIASENKGCLNGLHIYVGTNYKSHMAMIPALTAFFKLAEKVPDLEYVNIGGGIGVDYLNEETDFDLKEYGRCVIDLLKKLRAWHQKDIKLVFEPGRKLAAGCGALITKVTDVKKLNNTNYIVVDASIAIFPRPFHHPESPHKALNPFNTTNDLVPATVVGKTTFSKDILINYFFPKNTTVDDILLFEQTGAYCDSMRSKFLGQGEPENIFL